MALCRDGQNLFVSAAWSRKLETLNPRHRSFPRDPSTWQKHVRVGCNFAYRRLVMPSSEGSSDRRDSAPVSYSIATPRALVASLLLSGAGSWLMSGGCDIPGPFSCSARMGHAVPCAARHHIGSVRRSISNRLLASSDVIASH